MHYYNAKLRLASVSLGIIFGSKWFGSNAYKVISKIWGFSFATIVFVLKCTVVIWFTSKKLDTKINILIFRRGNGSMGSVLVKNVEVSDLVCLFNPICCLLRTSHMRQLIKNTSPAFAHQTVWSCKQDKFLFYSSDLVCMCHFFLEIRSYWGIFMLKYVSNKKFGIPFKFG